MRSRRFKVTVTAVLIVVTIGLVSISIGLYRTFWEGLYDIYAPYSAADLVIAHMNANNGDWPRSWEELHRTFLLEEQNGIFYGFSWDQYLRHVGIDFTFDPTRFVSEAETGRAWPRVIWSRGDVERFPGPTDPNERLLQYFEK